MRGSPTKTSAPSAKSRRPGSLTGVNRKLAALLVASIGIVVALGMFLAGGGRDGGGRGNPEAKGATTKASMADAVETDDEHDAQVAAMRESMPADAEPAAPLSDPSRRIIVGRVVDERLRPIPTATVLAAKEITDPSKPLWEGQGWRVDTTLDSVWTQEFSEDEILSTRTDSDGRFEVELSTDGPFLLAVRANGYARVDEKLVAPPGEAHHDVGDVILERGIPLEVLVVTPTGASIEGARLQRFDRTMVQNGSTIVPNLTLLGISDGRGVVDATLDATGPVEFLVRAEGYGEQEVAHTVLAGDSDPLTVLMHPEAVIRGRVLQGTIWKATHVWDAPTLGEIMTGRVRTRIVPCDANGNFEIHGVVPDEPELSLVAYGAARVIFPRPILSERVPAKPGDQDVVIALVPARRYRVGLVDQSSGSPVQGASIYIGSFVENLRSRNVQVSEPEAGIYDIDWVPIRLSGRLESVPPGQPRAEAPVWIDPPGYSRIRIGGVSSLPTEGADRVFLGTLGLASQPDAIVFVLDAATEGPLSEVEVECSYDRNPDSSSGVWIDGPWGDLLTLAFRNKGGYDDRRATDTNGIVRVPTTPPGAVFTLTAQHDEYATFEGTPPVRAEDGAFVVRLTPGATMDVRCIARGEPVAGGVVSHTGDGEAISGERRTDLRGRVTFKHLNAGHHEFRLSDASGLYIGSAECDVFEGDERLELTIVAKPIRFHGIVTDDGDALVGATVTRGSAWGTTDRSGAFDFDISPASGTVKAVVSTSRGPSAVAPIVVGGVDVEHDFELSLCSITGRVVDEFGRPVPDANVSVAMTNSDDAKPRVISWSGFGGAMFWGKSGPDGAFEIRDIDRRRRMALVASCPGYLEGRASLDVSDDNVDDYHLDITLRQAGTVEVVLIGKPRGVSVRARPSFDAKPESRIVWGSRTSFESLAPGTWTFEVTAQGDSDGLLASVPVDIQPGENPPVEIELR